MADRLKRGVRSLRDSLGKVLPTLASRITCALLAVVSACLCFIPGFNVLNYYSGLAIAIVGGLSVGLSNAGQPTGSDGDSLGRIVATRLVQATFLAAVPLSILLLNALRVTNCDLWAGVTFFAVGPLATILIASQWGLAARLLGRTGRRSILYFLLLYYL